MRRFNASLAVVVCLGAAAVLHHSLRQSLLALIRLPLTITEGAFSVVLHLPKLPALSREDARLRQQLASQQLELAQLRETIRHAAQASKLGVSQHAGAATEVAQVVGRTIIPTQHVVILNRGTRQHVAVEAVLMDVAGVAGRVIEANPTTSLGLLVTDPNSRIAAVVERSREAALLVGTGGRLCQLQYLDPDADVEPKDRVLTAGLGGPFPQGLLLGVVVKVDRDERNARLLAWVRPAVRVTQLEELLCVPPAKSD